MTFAITYTKTKRFVSFKHLLLCQKRQTVCHHYNYAHLRLFCKGKWCKGWFFKNKLRFLDSRWNFQHFFLNVAVARTHPADLSQEVYMLDQYFSQKQFYSSNFLLLTSCCTTVSKASILCFNDWFSALSSFIEAACSFATSNRYSEMNS